MLRQTQVILLEKKNQQKVDAACNMQFRCMLSMPQWSTFYVIYVLSLLWMKLIIKLQVSAAVKINVNASAIVVISKKLSGSDLIHSNRTTNSHFEYKEQLLNKETSKTIDYFERIFCI